jgi:hypothetical protein
MEKPSVHHRMWWRRRLERARQVGLRLSLRAAESHHPGNLIKPDGARGRSDHERAVAGVAACESNPFDGTVGLAAACRGPAEAGATRIALQKAFCSRRGTYYCWPAPHRATTRLACPCPPQVPSLAQWHRRLGSSAPERAQIPVSLP